MLSLMAQDRMRMIFDTQERYRRAVKLYAARHGMSTSDVVNHALDELLDKELSEADEIIAAEEKATKHKKKGGD